MDKHRNKVILDINAVLTQMGIESEKWEACCGQAMEGQYSHGFGETAESGHEGGQG